MRTLGARQIDPARRRRAHRAFLDRVGDQARARGCDQAGRSAQPPQPATGPGARGISGRALARSAEAAERGAQLDRMVRDAGPLSRLRPVAIHLFFAHSKPAHQPRKSPPPRRRVARRRREALLGTLRGCRNRRPADVRALPPARHDPRKPRRRLPHGDLLRDRRHARRLPPGPLRHARAGRRRAAVHRNDLRLADRADHARLHRDVRAAIMSLRGGGSSISSTLIRRRNSAFSSAIRAARDRPNWAGKRWTRRSQPETGR